MNKKQEIEPVICQNSSIRQWPLSYIGLPLLICLGLLGGLSQASRADNGAFSPMPLGVYLRGQDGTDNNSGPVRMVRFSYLSGDVTWRGGADGDWSPAARNLPLRQGGQIWVSDGGRAELQFDDGSRVRLDSNTLVTLQTLYSDTNGEFTEITLNEGEVFLRLTNRYSVYQVNTPEASLKATGPGRVRVGAGDGAQFAVRRGSATIEGASGKITLQQGDYLDVVDNTTPYNVGPLPAPDAWDTWNDARDRRLDGGGRSHLPSNIALVCDDLDANGSWHNDPQYGWVWVPRVTAVDWRPYSAGQWTWVEPFGWTWVATESWGWAPYHYGTWTRAAYGWAWCPGPSVQYWSPGVVSFCQSGTRVAWCPLAPREVVYPPAFSIGFHSGNWSLFFSIGSAAVYYPGPNNVCVARPWSSSYVNQVTYVNHVTNVTNINVTINRNTYVTNNFVPANARFQGGSQVEVRNFASSRAAYQPVASNNLAVFTRGQVIGAPTGGRPSAGPQSVPVTAQALTPSRTFQAHSPVPQAITRRPMFRAALPANVPRTASAPLQGQQFINRSTASVRPAAGQPGSISRPTSNRPANTTPGSTFGSRTAGTPPNRPNPGTSNTGRSSSLDQYLRDRNAARGGSPTNPNANVNRPAPSNNGTSNRTNANNGSNPTVNPPRNTNRSVTPPANTPRTNTPPANTPPANTQRTSNYRPLHTVPTNSGSRNNAPPGNSNGGGRSGKDSKPEGRDH
jgi:hypothetical protein